MPKGPHTAKRYAPREIPTRDGLPAINVKVYRVDWLDARELATQYDVTEAQAEYELEALWDIGVSDFWTRAEDIAREVFGKDAEVFSAGRSGGWLTVVGLSDPETWTAAHWRKWGRFHRELMTEIEYRRSRQWAEETIREGEMLPPPPTDAEMVRELSAALQGAIDEMTPLLRHSADFPEWYTSGLAALAKLPEGRDHSMSRTVPSNTDDIVDSRDIIARIRELEADRDDLITAREEAEEQAANGEREPLTDDEFMMDEDDAAELAALRALAEEASSSPDWQHGATLIADHYFEDYAREMASDLYGREIDDARWPFDCIDWERAAEALQQDYTSVEWAGATYWLR